ncbi:alpha-ribazole phosphatase [Flavobacteriaceae bacterium AU392]|nr:alpha-ribazole phosphatase [Flavobacteriaceae bacterium]RKM83530.1 alpha-ribazole phosphatase [Flavobacteriaceae bacterium AU392]
MDIYIIRHTTPKIEKGICYGQTNLDLVENYIKEFETIRSQIPNDRIYNVISSPLKRCDLLAQEFDTEVTYDNRLKELNFGNWEMKPWNVIPSEEIDPWMKDFVNIKTPNGESYIQLASRVSDFFEELTLFKSKKDVIIVTHAGPIRSLLAKLLNIPLEKSFSIKIQYGEVFHLKKEESKLKIVSKINIS